MNLRIVGALVQKDVSLFFRNGFFTVITVLAIVCYLIIYFLMPRSVDETLDIGLYAPNLPLIPGQMQEAEGFTLGRTASEEELKSLVAEGEYAAGLVIPSSMVTDLLSGRKPHFKVYFPSDVPTEFKEAIEILLEELAYMIAGQPLSVEITEEVLGTDMLGMQIAPRDRLRPLLVVIIVLMEALGLANLITEEVEHRTLRALLVTPVTVKELFAAKGITGMGMAFVQAVFFMTVVGGLSVHPLIVLTALFLGSVLVTAVSFLIASVGRDFMSVIAWGFLALIILMVPTLAVAFPGPVSGWIKVIPSYYLIETVHKTSNFNIGWSGSWQNLLILLGFDVGLVWLGIMALKRKTK